MVGDKHLEKPQYKNTKQQTVQIGCVSDTAVKQLQHFLIMVKALVLIHFEQDSCERALA